MKECLNPQSSCWHRRYAPGAAPAGLCEADEGTPCPAAAPAGALAAQVGGDHYKHMAIQPVEFIHRNGLGFCEGCVIKYVSRWRAKGGVQDLEKARHFLNILIEMEGKQ